MPVPQDISASVQKYGLNYIRPYHREIARRLVLGQTQGEICKQLGISASRMSIIVHSPLFKLELKRLEKARDEGVEDVTRTLQEISPVAIEVLERLMYEGKPQVRLQAASTLLDRAGYGAVNKVQVSANINYVDQSMTDDELRRMISERLNRMEKNAQEKADMMSQAEAIEVEYEDVRDIEQE